MMDSAIVVAIISATATVFNVVFTTLSSRKTEQAARRAAEEAEKCKQDRSVADGLQCLLRAEIIRAHDKYTQKHFCPIYAKESLTRAYAAYHALGGNDVATDLYRQCMELPESEEHND